MTIPFPTPIFRIAHIDNLHTILTRGGLYAPNNTPSDGLPYITIHNAEIQSIRRQRNIPCGPGGVIHEYVSFYFGPLSPMLLQLKTGQVGGYSGGLEPIIYLVSTCQTAVENGYGFVFSNGHGVARFTDWFDDLSRLGKVDWVIVGERYWHDIPEDNDRKRRKQAEFLVHRFLSWEHIEYIGVINDGMRKRTQTILDSFPEMKKPVKVKPDWYY